MKKILSLVLAVLMLSSALAPCASAAGEKHSGITLERTETNGVSHPVGYYTSEKRYEKMPVTFEAWVYLPKSALSERGGIIIGNYQSFTKDDYINFEIHENGVPRLLIGDPSGTLHDYKFTKAALRPNTWTHVSIVYGTGEGGKQIFCYINGEFKQATAVSSFFKANPEALDNELCLAGDRRALNEQGFRGTLGDVAVYSDIRTPEEILSDYNNAPSTSDEELILYYALSDASAASDITDASGNGYDMSYYRVWLTEKEMEEIRAEDERTYSYALAFLPDIQYMTGRYPKQLPSVFDYLVNRSKAQNIRYAIGLGDMTDANGVKEWSTVTRQANRLNGYLDYSLVCGNHDNLKNNKAELFDKSFATKTGYYYRHVAANGGFFDEASVRNTYLTFSVGEVKYIIINLDFGASDDVLAWAGRVLDEHPEHRGILVTHGYLNADGTTLDTNDYASPDTYDPSFNNGEDMWEKLASKHENVSLVVSGHIHHDSAVVTPRKGDAGNTVYQVLMDTQTSCKKLKGMGTVALMYFTEDGNHARIEYYSTVFGKYFSESNKTLSLSFAEEVAEETTAAETTALPATSAEEASDTASPVPAEKGCGGVTAAYASLVVILGAILCRKRKKSVCTARKNAE